MDKKKLKLNKLVMCTKCHTEMEVIITPKMEILECGTCGALLELPKNKNNALEYTKILLTEAPKIKLSDVTTVELQKRKERMVLNEDYSINIQMESERDLEILEKHLKRDISTIRSNREELSIRIPKLELPAIYDQEVLPEEIVKKILNNFRTKEFIQSYITKITSYFKYATMTQEGRMVFEIPSDRQQAELQRILVVTKIFFIQEQEHILYLPWNSVLLVQALVRVPTELREQIVEFMLDTWQKTNAYHRNMALEIELTEHREEKGIKHEKDEKGLKELKSKKTRKIMDYI